MNLFEEYEERTSWVKKKPIVETMPVNSQDKLKTMRQEYEMMKLQRKMNMLRQPMQTNIIKKTKSAPLLTKKDIAQVKKNLVIAKHSLSSGFESAKNIGLKTKRFIKEKSKRSIYDKE